MRLNPGGIRETGGQIIRGQRRNDTTPTESKCHSCGDKRTEKRDNERQENNEEEDGNVIPGVTGTVCWKKKE